METEVKLTKLAQCAGCGAKVGAGTLAKLLDGIPTRSDERLLVGFDKSDDASVYKIDDNTALVQTLDFSHRSLMIRKCLGKSQRSMRSVISMRWELIPNWL